MQEGPVTVEEGGVLEGCRERAGPSKVLGRPVLVVAVSVKKVSYSVFHNSAYFYKYKNVTLCVFILKFAGLFGNQLNAHSFMVPTAVSLIYLKIHK